MKKTWLLILVGAVVILAAAVVYLAPRFAPIASGPLGGAASPSQDIGVLISLPHAPRLNEPISVEATFTPRVADVPDLEGHITLPTGAVYLDGDMIYRGPAKKDYPVSISARIAIVEPGKWEISASAEAAEYIKGITGGPLEHKPWYPGLSGE